MTFPDHTDLLDPAILRIIERADWRNARSVEHVPGGRHAYVVLPKDDEGREGFWLLVKAIRALGRREVWRSPPGFYDHGRQIEMVGSYLYVRNGGGDLFAYFFSHPRNAIPMCNREAVAVQLAHPTRRPLAPGERLPKTTTHQEADHVGTQLKLT